MSGQSDPPALGMGAGAATLSPARANSHPPSSIPMKRSLSRENEPQVQSPAPGAQHATPTAGTPEPTARHVKTKAKTEKVGGREGGREKKESWKKKEAQNPAAAGAGAPNAKDAGSKATQGGAEVGKKEGPPALQRFLLPPAKEADYQPARAPVLLPVTYV